MPYRKCVFTALATRLEQVQLEASETSPSSSMRDASSHEPLEVCLRIVMTQLLPKLHRQKCHASDFQLGLELLEIIQTNANHADLRFVDAWNCVYEAIEGWGWEEAGLSALSERFLHGYIEMLRTSIANAQLAPPGR